MILEGVKYHRIADSSEEWVEQILKILVEADLPFDSIAKKADSSFEALAKEEEKEKNLNVFPLFE